MKSQSDILFLFIPILLLNYLGGSFNKIENTMDNYSVVNDINDSIYRTWVKDTLPFMKLNLAKEKNKDGGFKDYRIEISNDSLSLDVVRLFEIDLNTQVYTNTKINKMVENVLSILKDYGEFPNGIITLKFAALYWYFPSSVPQRAFDYTLDYQNVELSNSDSSSNYTFIRGRIGNKEVTKIINGKEVVTHYEFIWEGDKLRKVKM